MAAYSVPTNLKPPKFANVAQSAVAITPADNTRIGPYQRLYVGTGGNVVLVPANSTSPVTYRNVQSGQYIDVCFQGINATNTTAEDMIGEG